MKTAVKRSNNTRSKPPIARLSGERSDRNNDHRFAMNAVNDREGELLWINPARAMFVRRADVRKRARNLQRRLDLVQKTLTETCKLTFVVTRFRLHFGLCLGEKAN